jgi:hypothetical protein
MIARGKGHKPSRQLFSADVERSRTFECEFLRITQFDRVSQNNYKLLFISLMQ